MRHTVASPNVRPSYPKTGQATVVFIDLRESEIALLRLGKTAPGRVPFFVVSCIERRVRYHTERKTTKYSTKSKS